MGLLLLCGEVAVKMGSYSSVHTERRRWIEAYNKWLGTLEDKESELTLTTADGDSLSELDYHIVETLDTVNIEVIPVLEGLQRFVVHSDCEGRWSTYDAQSILDTLDSLKRFLCDEDEDEYYLEGILKYSVEHHADIIFC